MPNMVEDGLLDQAFFVRTISSTPPNLDYQLQNLVSSAISAAAVQGLFTCTANISAYSANNYDLVIRLIERLVNMGYTASLATNTLTVNWSVA